MGDLLETAVPILGGLYATLLGYRVIGGRHRYENQLRLLGPPVMLFGFIWMLKALGRYYS